MESIHIEGQIIQFPFIISNRTVYVIIKFYKLTGIVPDFFIGCVKYMSTIGVYIDSIPILAVYIAAFIAAPFQN